MERSDEEKKKLRHYHQYWYLKCDTEYRTDIHVTLSDILEYFP